MPGDYFLDLVLASSSFYFGLSIPGTNILRDYFVDDNLIKFILVKIYCNNPRACLIITTVACPFGVFMLGVERKFVFDRNVPDDL
jgi:hypothetical protein